MTGILIFLSIFSTCLGQMGPPPGGRGPAMGVGPGTGGGMGMRAGSGGIQHHLIGEPGENPFALDGLCWSLENQLRAKNPTSSTREVIADKLHGLISSYLGGGGEIPSSGGGNVACTIRGAKKSGSNKKTPVSIADLATAVSDKAADSGCRIPCFDPTTGMWAQPPPGMAPPSPTPALNIEPPPAPLPGFFDTTGAGMGPLADPYNPGLGGRRAIDPLAVGPGAHDPGMSQAQRSSRMRGHGQFDRSMRSQGAFGPGRGSFAVDPLTSQGPYDPAIGGQGQLDPSMSSSGQFDSRMGRSGRFDVGMGRPRQFDAAVGRTGQFDAGMGRTGQSDAGMGRPGQFDAGMGRTGQFDAGMGRTGQFDGGLSRTGQFDAGMGRAGQFDTGMGRPGHFDAGIGRMGQFDAGMGRKGQFDAGMGRIGQVDAGMSRTGQFGAGMGRTGQVDTGMSRTGQLDAGMGRTGQVDTGMSRTGHFDAGMGRTGQLDSGMSRTGQFDAWVGRTGQLDSGMSRTGQFDAGMGRAGQVDSGIGRTGQFDASVGRTGHVGSGMGRTEQFAGMGRSAPHDSSAGGSRFNDLSMRGNSLKNQGVRSGQFDSGMSRRGFMGMETRNLGRPDTASMGGWGSLDRNFGSKDSFNRGIGRTEFNEMHPRLGRMGSGLNQRDTNLFSPSSGVMAQQGMSGMGEFSQRRMGDTGSMGASVSSIDMSLGMGMGSNSGVSSAMSNRAQISHSESSPSPSVPHGNLRKQTGLGQQGSNAMSRDPASVSGPVFGVGPTEMGIQPMGSSMMGAAENTNMASSQNNAAQASQGNNQMTSSQNLPNSQGASVNSLSETTFNPTSTSQQVTTTSQPSGMDNTIAESTPGLNKDLSKTEMSSMTGAPAMKSQTADTPRSSGMMSQSSGMMSQSSNMMSSSGSMMSESPHGMASSTDMISPGRSSMPHDMLTNIPGRVFPRDGMGGMSNGNSAMFRESQSAMSRFNNIPSPSAWRMNNLETQRAFADGPSTFSQDRGNQMPSFPARRTPQGAFFNQNVQFDRRNRFISAAAGRPERTFSKRPPINSVDHRHANFNLGDPAMMASMKQNQNHMSGPESPSSFRDPAFSDRKVRSNQLHRGENLSPMDNMPGNNQMSGLGSNSISSHNAGVGDLHNSQVDPLMPKTIPDTGMNTIHGTGNTLGPIPERGTQASGATGGTNGVQADPLAQSAGPQDPLIHEPGFANPMGMTGGNPYDMTGAGSNGLGMGPDPFMGPDVGISSYPMRTGRAGYPLDPVQSGIMDMATAVDPFHGAGLGSVGDPLSMMGIGAAGDPHGSPLNTPSSAGMGAGPVYDPPHHSGMGVDLGFGGSGAMGGRMDIAPPPPPTLSPLLFV